MTDQFTVAYVRSIGILALITYVTEPFGFEALAVVMIGLMAFVTVIEFGRGMFG